jgi:glycosyltransferase involved in cell wall biosynthesis
VTRHLDFFPDWRRGNPYLSMLFSRLVEIGVESRPTGRLTAHLARAAASDDPGVLNVHWTSPILARARDAGEARAAVGRLTSLVDAFVRAGGRLVWTVHNVLPHDPVHVDEEVEICRLLADRAHLVHVLCDETLTAVAPHYRLDPARTVVIPHSSYAGAYPDDVTREQARRRLELDAEAQALVTLGRIRPYKGIDRLLDAVERPPLDGPGLRLLVAGLEGTGPGMRELVDRLAATPRVVSRAHRVARRDVQVWMRAADLAVLPFTGILNSGSFLLAETFGLPIVAPRQGALRERDGQPHVWLFDADDFEGTLASAVRSLADPDVAEAAHASASATAAANPPALMARRFADAVAPLW